MESFLANFIDFLSTEDGGLYRIGASLAIIVVLFILNRVLRRVAGRFGVKSKNMFVIRKVIGYVTGVLTVILVGGVWFESIGALTTFLGLLSAGVAIALKDVVADIAGWVFILTRKPFALEDRIEAMGTKGDVVDIRLFKTTLLEVGNWVEADQSTGRIVHLPNKFVFSESIANYSKGFRFIWNEIPVLITFESDWKLAKTLLMDIVNRYGVISGEETRKALKEAGARYLISYKVMTPAVYTSVRDSGVLLTLRYLCKPQERRSTEQDIWEEILSTFAREETIALAYPTTRFYTKSGESSP